MASGRVVSVNTGRAAAAPWAGRPGRTAIDKRPAGGPVAVGRLGLAGDEQADTAHHGGAEQAVYAYAREDLDWWVERLGREIRAGEFGENITTAGIDVTAALVGERWRVGAAVLQVTSCRIPCSVFRGWMDEPGWVKRFAGGGRPGAYLRVLREGPVAAGDPVEVLGRPAVRVTVGEAMRAHYGDAGAAARLRAVAGLRAGPGGDAGPGGGAAREA